MSGVAVHFWSKLSETPVQRCLPAILLTVPSRELRIPWAADRVIRSIECPGGESGQPDGTLAELSDESFQGGVNRRTCRTDSGTWAFCCEISQWFRSSLSGGSCSPLIRARPLLSPAACREIGAFSAQISDNRKQVQQNNRSSFRRQTLPAGTSLLAALTTIQRYSTMKRESP